MIARTKLLPIQWKISRDFFWISHIIAYTLRLFITLNLFSFSVDLPYLTIFFVALHKVECFGIFCLLLFLFSFEITAFELNILDHFCCN